MFGRWSGTYLEHLDVGNAEVQVRSVTKDEAAAEEQPDREDGAHKHRSGHVDVLDAIEQTSRPLKHPRANSLPRKQVRCRQ